MSIRKTVKGYQISTYDADGRLRRKTFKGIDRKEALRLEREILADRDRGERPPDERNAPTFSTFAEKVWMVEGEPRWKPSTVMQYQDVLKRLKAPFGEIQVSRITEAKVSPWIASLQAEGLSPRRINLYLVTLKSILKLARRRRLLREDSLAGVRLLRESRTEVDPLDPQEVAAFLEACPDWWFPYFTVAFFAGSRPNEQAALKWGDVDWQGATFRIRAGMYRWVEGTPKTESSIRDVDMLPPVVEAFKTQRKQQAAQRLKEGQGVAEVGKDYVFTMPRGGRLNINAVRDGVWYPTLKKATLRRRTMYQTRHTFASNALAAGESPAWVAAQLGHKGAEVLFDVYARFIPNRTRRDGSALAARMVPGRGIAPLAAVQVAQARENEPLDLGVGSDKIAYA